MTLKLIAKLSGATLALGMAFGAAAVPVASVGLLDTMVGSAKLDNSSLASENAFVQTLLGNSYTLTGKFDSVNAGDWESVDGVEGGYALNFNDINCTTGSCSTTPAYYVIKLGTGGSPEDTADTFLFRNLNSLEWAYVQLQQFTGVSNMNIGRVSHITVGNGGGEVPEPASLALLGLGLLGLGAARRVRPARKA